MIQVKGSFQLIAQIEDFLPTLINQFSVNNINGVTVESIMPMVKALALLIGKCGNLCYFT